MTDTTIDENVNGFSPGDAQADGLLHTVKQIISSRLLSAKEKCGAIQGLLPSAPPPEIEMLSAAQEARNLAWAVWQKTDGACTYCGQRLNPFDRIAPNGFHIDHHLARALGGTDDVANLVPACLTCNCKKKALSPDDWRAANAC